MELILCLSCIEEPTGYDVRGCFRWFDGLTLGDVDFGDDVVFVVFEVLLASRFGSQHLFEDASRVVTNLDQEVFQDLAKKSENGQKN